MQKEDKFLNMIMEFIPETLWSVAQCDGTNRPLLEALYVKVLSHLPVKPCSQFDGELTPQSTHINCVLFSEYVKILSQYTPVVDHLGRAKMCRSICSMFRFFLLPEKSFHSQLFSLSKTFLTARL